MKKELVKHNINFLEYPLWFQDERSAENNVRGMTWKDRDGYVFECGYKMPVKTDAIFLLYLLLQSQKNKYADTVFLSRYQIIKECGKTMSKIWYDRLEESLKRWKMVGITFAGTFYDGKDYQIMNFGIIDSWKIHEKTKKLEVTFSPTFIKMMRGKGFFKYVNFTEFKKLDSPLATRLYEILSKTFHGRNFWKIDAIKLGEKIPLAQNFASDVIRKIKPAVNRINKKTDLKVELEVISKERGKSILVFKKLQAPKKPETAQSLFDFNFDDIQDSFKEVINALPKAKQDQKTILSTLRKFYNKLGKDYVIRNIKYTNRYVKKNYRKFLSECLKNDWGLALAEDEAERALQEQQKLEEQKEATKKLQAEFHKKRQEQELEEKISRQIDSLTTGELETLRTKAIKDLPPEIMNLWKRGQKAADIAVNQAMRSVVRKELLAEKIMDIE